MQDGFEFFRQFAGLDMVTAKAFDSPAGHFTDMEKVSAGGYDLVKNRIRTPIMALQGVVLNLVLT
jgi:hypothetical protein